MRRSFLFKLFGVVILFSLVFGLAGFNPVNAVADGQSEYMLSDLGMDSPAILTGPVAEYSLRFNLPVEMRPEGTVTLNVDLTAFFSSLVASETTDSISGLVGGNISLYLNDTLLEAVTLSQPGQQALQVTFDAGLFQLATRNDINNLRIRWDGSISCSMNLLSSVTILPSSKLSFTYGENPAVVSLNDFPVPFIIENSVDSIPLKLVLPEAPTAAELRSAMIVAAGIGQISNGQNSVEVVSTTDYRPTQANPQNVILVANSETLKTLSLSSLGIAEGVQPAAGEGLLVFFEPQGGFGLLVSGDETGIVKAAQAVAANQVIAGGDGNTMVVSGVNPSVVNSGLEDMTLEDLGAGELVFTQPNNLVQSVDFFMPAGNQVRADASFSLIISHSQQLDYLSSGLQVKVNGYPAVSLRLTDNTSNQAVFTLIMPSNLIHPGRNTVEFVADLNTRDLCTAPTETVAWIRVSSSSLLHLPLETAVGESTLAKTFGDFPDAFLAGSGLNDVTLVIGKTDFSNIQSAAKLAGELGAALPDHSVLELNALFSDAAEITQAAQASMILVGNPSDFSSLNETSEFPTMVFNADNSLSDQSALELVSKPEAGADVGYLAIRGFDATSSKVLMAVLGNTATGVNYAVEAVTSKGAAENNFVTVVADAVQSGWMDEGIATGEVTSTTITAPPTTETVDPVQVFKVGMRKWAVPLLALLLGAMLFFLYIEIRQNLRKTK